jgi:hypothetical protein
MEWHRVTQLYALPFLQTGLFSDSLLPGYSGSILEVMKAAGKDREGQLGARGTEKKAPTIFAGL